ncbi:hypothetical protein [Paenibacillus glycinis]|uniref:Uncharacterized protein n=1 Tax=Paenibacillus glycinis TaxID=2697035 RepID=A0ABW9Y041_9BACL|nr:hypothetical protein [Paenibacillus glycinis]NBD27854.1 hypothetical protein [Paenibacillus glycinis]
MQELRLARTYKTIYIPLASFMCISDRDVAMRALEQIFQHLDDGGQVLIPLFVPSNVNKKEWTVGRRGMRDDGAEVIVSSISSVQFHEQVQRSDDRYEIIRDGRLIDTVFSTSKL